MLKFCAMYFLFFSHLGCSHTTIFFLILSKVVTSWGFALNPFLVTCTPFCFVFMLQLCTLPQAQTAGKK